MSLVENRETKPSGIESNYVNTLSHPSRTNLEPNDCQSNRLRGHWHCPSFTFCFWEVFTLEVFLALTVFRSSEASSGEAIPSLSPAIESALRWSAPKNPFIWSLERITTWTFFGILRPGAFAAVRKVPFFIALISSVAKSTFGSHLFNFGDQRIKSLFEELYEKNRYKDDFIKDSLRETLTVTIPLDLHQPAEGPTLQTYVSQLIFVSTLNQLFGVNEAAARDVWLRSCPDVKSCVELLSSLVLKPIFFHFDEISVLSHYFPQLAPESDRWNIYYEFWRVAIPIHSQACFMFISGKVMELNAMGKGLKHSPGKVSHVHLGLLRATTSKTCFGIPGTVWQLWLGVV
jgi:hypothetical protein